VRRGEHDSIARHRIVFLEIDDVADPDLFGQDGFRMTVLNDANRTLVDFSEKNC
jgi:hypothetical protein